MSHLSESNQRPTDYKSVALPAELKWRIHVFSNQRTSPGFLRDGKSKVNGEMRKKLFQFILLIAGFKRPGNRLLPKQPVFGSALQDFIIYRSRLAAASKNSIIKTYCNYAAIFCFCFFTWLQILSNAFSNDNSNDLLLFSTNSC